MDETAELFIPFHLLASKAIAAIVESYNANNNPYLFVSNPIASWLRCNFSGLETFEEVCQTFNPTIGSLREYIHFIMLIPGMTSLIRILCRQGNSQYIVGLIMSLSSFIQFNKQNYCRLHFDAILNGYSRHSVFAGCDRCKENSKLQESSKEHVNTCSYYRLQMEVMSSEDMLKCSLVAEYVVEMYEKAITLAMNGNLGKGFPPPKELYVRQESQSYMLCEYVNTLDGEKFFKWLSLYEALQVSSLHVIK